MKPLSASVKLTYKSKLKTSSVKLEPEKLIESDVWSASYEYTLLNPVLNSNEIEPVSLSEG